MSSETSRAEEREVRVSSGVRPLVTLLAWYGCQRAEEGVGVTGLRPRWERRASYAVATESIVSRRC